MIGETVLHYQIVRKLGQGGMGTVYEAIDTRLQRSVALKVLRSDGDLTPLARQRLLTEATAASALDHPNVCTIYAIEETSQGELLLAMAFYRGQTLDQLIAQGPLKFERIGEIASQICLALHATHAAGIIHRDIKPSNVLLTENNAVKVLDFGLSKITTSENQTRLTSPNQVMGTVLYMSPEQLRGGEVDHRTDLWALGTLVYEMTTGFAPFHRSTPTAIMHAISFEDYAPLLDLRPNVPASIEALVHGALQKNVIDRWASASKMLEELAGPSSGVSRTALVKDTPTPINVPRTERAGAAAGIAVLPLQNLSTDPENEYFSDGLTEELISVLAQPTSLRVVSRSSAFAFKGKADDVRRIGKELGVDFVLEGGVRRSGSKIRVTLQVTSVSDGYQVWSERYDREMASIFDLQDEIAQSVVEALRSRLGANISHPVGLRVTDNIEAYEVYLKGRYEWNRKTPDSIQLAGQYFSQALGIDPDFALAHSGMADYYSLLASLWIIPAQEAWPLARRSALRAIALNDQIADPHISLGFVRQFYEWDWENAEKEMRLAISLRPQLGDSYVSFAYHLMTQGRLQLALEVTRVGQQYDPVSVPLRTTEAMILTYLGEHDAAITLARRAIETAPHFIELYYVLGVAYLSAGRSANAVEILEIGANAARRFPLLLGWLGAAYVQAGELAQAEEVLEELLNHPGQSFAVPLPLAVLYTALKRFDDAFDWLGRAADARDTILCYLQVMPAFNLLRSDHRYEQLLQRMGLAGQKSSSHNVLETLP